MQYDIISLLYCISVKCFFSLRMLQLFGVVTVRTGSVDVEEIQALYGSKFMITKVDSAAITLSGGEACNEDVYLLERNRDEA